MPGDLGHLAVGSSSFALCPFHICGASVSMKSDALTLFKGDGRGRGEERGGTNAEEMENMEGEEDRTRDEGEKISLFLLSSKRDPYSSLSIIDLEHEKRRNTSSTYLGLTFYN